MATIKSFTDISQSKKLAEILPLESADMYYISGDECDICFGSGVYEEIADWLSDGAPRLADIPCWSLAALLSVLPKGYSLGRRTNGKYYVCMTCVKHDVVEYDNPVDACYEMIIRLNELKLL